MDEIIVHLEELVDQMERNDPHHSVFLTIGKIFVKFLKKFCWPPIQVYSRLVSLLSFTPFKPSYRFVSYNTDNKLHLRLSREVLAHSRQVIGWYDPSLHWWTDYLNCLTDCESFFCQTSRGNTIAGLFIRALQKTDLNLIFSHNNCTDLGIRSEMLWRISREVRCNVIAYDYSGFGLSTGKPSEKNIYADIDSVFVYVNTRYGIRSEKTLLYGESIGSVPTVDLATRLNFLGVILESPIVSGLRTCFKDMTKELTIDPFSNITKAHRIKCKVLLICGTRDQLLGKKDVKLFMEKLKYPVKPFVIKEFEHNCSSIHPLFYCRINYFIDHEIVYKH